MPSYLNAALEYLPRWIELQMRVHEQPGCAVALAHRGRVVWEEAFGVADLGRGTPLTPRHRFRAASHSKSFTAAALMKLREQERLRLEDPVGRYVDGLHPAVARVTLVQLLSHSAGIVRDGSDAGQFVDQRPFLSAEELRFELRRAPPVIAPNTRFKYSNHGYGLLGLVVEAVTGEPWGTWLQREIIESAGLAETLPDGPPPKRMPMALGHSGKLPVGRRLVIPGDYATHAIAPAGGVISTAGDLARFFCQLSPNGGRGVVSVASRREMVRPQWRDPHSRFERWYGLGLACGNLAGWQWFGHSGGLQGYITRTCVFPAQDLALSVLTNAIDAPAYLWLEGLARILRTYAEHGAPSPRTRDWSGRWWNLWGTIDLLPVRAGVLVANPAFFDPLQDASEIRVGGRDCGLIRLAAGYAAHGEPARLVRNRRREVTEVWLGGTRYRPEHEVAKEMKARYGGRR
jgi:CubicO group peptidase (beta-lactamase class C family)